MGVNDTEQENYIGGLASSYFKKGLMSGYGVYATTRRIIGVHKRKGVFAGKFVGGLFGSAGSIKNQLVSSAVGHAITHDESVKQIEDLEKDKDFEIVKEDIREIEVKKPGTLRAGHIKIKPKSGKDVNVDMKGQQEYDYIRQLMLAFYPEAVKVVE